MWRFCHRYLATAAASAQQHERVGGTAGLQPLRPDAATCAAAARKPAYGIPARNVAAKRPADTYGTGLALAEAKRRRGESTPNPMTCGGPTSGGARRGVDDGDEMVVLEDTDIDFGAEPRGNDGGNSAGGPLPEANRRAAQIVRDRGAHGCSKASSGM